MPNVALQRIIALIDMDCFYCQVEARLDPKLKGKPIAVVQYNQWKGGGIIAVNYEARNAGVSRGMRGSEAQKRCPDICLVSVPCVRGKADLTKYRDAGEEVAAVFSDFSDCVQRASIDEAYIDLTKAVNDRINNGLHKFKKEDLPNTFVVGHSNLKNNSNDERSKGLGEWLKLVDSQGTKDSADFHLTVGALIVEEMRGAVLNRTGFHCSAGIAHNKILAKLVAGLHKPKCQTVLPHDSVPELYDTLPIHKVRNLGGKMGKYVAEKLSVSFMSELYQFSLKELQQKVDDKTGTWLFNIARGIDLDPVTPRLRPESIGCCKTFPGKNALCTVAAVEHWVKELSVEISERLTKDLEKNKRRAKLMTVSFHQENAMSRSGPLNSYDANVIANDALCLLKKFNTGATSIDSWHPPIKILGISISKFSDEYSSIGKYLKSKEGDDKERTNCPSQIDEEITAVPNSVLDNISSTNNTTTPSSFLKINNEKSKEYNENSIKKYFSKANDIDAESTVGTTSTKINGSTLDVEKPELKSSFFLSFLNKRKNTVIQKEEDSEDELSQKMCVSLSEVFPDINEADSEIVELLPKEMKEKYKKRISEELIDVKPSTSNSSRANTATSHIESETCSECRKSIPLIDFWEHLDYHAAMKIDKEINGNRINTSVKTVNVEKVENSVSSKRKKGRPSKLEGKKMKSITSFFTVVPKS